MPRRIALATLAAVTLVGCAGAPAGQPVEPYTLENGLMVVLRPIAGADKVALAVLHPMGGHHDPEGQSGLAHLIEHCYVTAQGGPTPPRTMQEYVARYPAGWNAQTGDRFTVAACVFPPERLEAELRDAAARLGDLRITKADLAREVPRVVSELANMFGGMPMLAAANLAREHVRPTPRGGRKGGRPEHVQALTAEGLQQRWDRFYRANGTTLVLAGAIDPQAIRDRIHHYFHTLPPGEPAPAPADVPEPNLPVTETVEVRAVQPNAPATACLAWAAPQPDNDLYAPFLVLVARLWRQVQAAGGGMGGPMVRFAPLDDPHVIAMTGPAAGQTPEQAVAGLKRLLASAVGQAFSPADVAAARGAFGWMLGVADVPDAMLARNVYGVAFAAGRRAQLGIDPVDLRARLDAVTAADVKRAAETIFAPDRRAAVVVLPAIRAGS
ncbi:MAG: insulinase family protein [Planctomycetota bacterium]|nr:insulinase family protein [Planctomycetota bacterium]